MKQVSSPKMKEVFSPTPPHQMKLKVQSSKAKEKILSFYFLLGSFYLLIPYTLFQVRGAGEVGGM
jgi:hypothetical protein